MSDMNVSLQVTNKMRNEEAMSTSQNAAAYGPTSHTILSAATINSEIKNSISEQNMTTNRESCASDANSAVASALDSISKRTSDPSVYEVL